jgi:MFS family permease
MVDARAWLAVAVLLVLSIVSYVDRSLIALMVEPIKADLGLGDFAIGMVQGVGFGLFYALFGVPMGHLVDRFPRRIVIWGGVSVWSLATAACGLANNVYTLTLARFGVGVGEATLSPAAYSIIGDLFPPRRLAFAIGLFGIGGILGISAAFALGGAIVTAAERIVADGVPLLSSMRPWQIAFVLAGLPGLLFAFLIFLIPEPARRQIASETGHAPGFIPFLRERRRLFACHFVGFGLIATLSYGMMAWTPAFLMRRFDMTVGEAGILLGTVGAFAGVGGQLFNGWIVDQGFHRGIRDMHLRYYAVTTGVGAIAAALAFSVAPSLFLVTLAYSVVYFLQPFTGPAAALLQIVSPSRYRGRVSALFLLVMNMMGLCLGPPLVSAFTQFLFQDDARVGDAITLMFALVAPLAIALFWLGLSPARAATDAATQAS